MGGGVHFHKKEAFWTTMRSALTREYTDRTSNLESKISFYVKKKINNRKRDSEDC